MSPVTFTVDRGLHLRTPFGWFDSSRRPSKSLQTEALWTFHTLIRTTSSWGTRLTGGHGSLNDFNRLWGGERFNSLGISQRAASVRQVQMRASGGCVRMQGLA